MRTRGVTCSALGLMVLSIAGCTEVDPDRDSPERDFSDFNEFEISQGPGLGFCPILDAPFQASITRQNGAHAFQISLIEAGDPATDVCEANVVAVDTCVVIRELSARELTAAEIERLRNTFRHVGVRRVEVDGSPCDACRVIRVRWDDFEIDDFPMPCPPRVFEALDDGEIPQIFALLTDLAGGPSGQPGAEPPDPEFIADVAGAYHINPPGWRSTSSSARAAVS